MKMSAFDAWLTHDPRGDEDVPPPPHHCMRCMSFVSREPFFTIDGEQGYECCGASNDEWGYGECNADAPHEPHFNIEWVNTVEYRWCKRCQRWTQEVVQ